MHNQLRMRVISFLLVMIMVIGMMPLTAFATEENEGNAPMEQGSNPGTTIDEGVATATYLVEHYLQNAEGYELKETETLEGTVGEPTAATAKAYDGFAANEYLQSVVAEDDSDTIQIYYDAVDAEPEVIAATYTVEHYLQNAEGYELKEYETLEGTVGEATAAAAKTYDGFQEVSFEQATVLADGTAVVKIYYNALPVVTEVGDGKLPADMTVISDKESTLAPGITLDEIVAYDKNKARVEIYVATADVSVDTVGIYATYKDDQNDVYGMSKLTEQVAAAEAKHDEPYSVVSGINASYYNMTNGKPLGAFVMKGNDVTSQYTDKAGNLRWEGDDYAFFAILNDGTPFIGDKGEYSKYRGQIAEAVQGHIHLINDGKIVAGLDAVTKYPRQTVGITADGKVITMTADGNQAPKSIGLTVQEQAEVMLALGCVEAVHLDGGGSCTYGAKPEGEDTFRVISSPSDGSARSVSNSLIFVSTAAPDGAFHHATVSAEHAYVTPGSAVNISAVGVDFAGGPAEIPTEGITWQVEDATLGTVANGVFTASDKTGDAKVQMLYNGTEVGSVTIHVVIPDTLAFDNATITVPYGRKVTLSMTALSGVNEVAMKAGDVLFELENTAAGTIDGFDFTACQYNETITNTKISAKLFFDKTITADANIVFGKGSEVVYDFEDGTTGGLYLQDEAYNYVWPECDSSVVTTANGKVHSGNYAMKLEVDYSNSLESGYQRMILRVGNEQVFKGATKVGMWIYISDENVGAWIRWGLPTVTFKEDGTYTFGSVITGQDIDGHTGGTGVVYTFDEPGWHYLSMDIDPAKYQGIGWKNGSQLIQMYICDRDGEAFGYKFKDQHNVNGDFTFYVDDITIDYSTAVDDREAPVISNLTYANTAMADAAALSGLVTSTNNTLSFAASAADFEKYNAVGLDGSTAKVYIDGNEVPATFASGKISTDNIELADGVHTVKFSICDKMGNYASKIAQINVDAKSAKSTIKVVPHDASLNRILLGSVYYIDVVATDIEKVQTVTTSLDLDNMSNWQLDHMDVAEGFNATYSLDADENVATIMINRVGEVSATGEAALVSIPVRTWELKTGYKYENGTKKGSEAFTYAQFRSMHEFWPIYVDVEVDYGKVSFTSGVSDIFSGSGVEVQTEMWHTYANMTATPDGLAYFNSWNGGHTHTAEAIADKAPTCTEKGYTGRTFCAVCNSPVVWGTTADATGHSYEFIDGLLKCKCDKLFNGVHTDGKTYVDGVCIDNGWNGDSYYVDGNKLTGVQLVNAPDSAEEFYYNFGEDGICAGQIKYTGLVFGEDGKTYFSKVGKLAASWQLVDSVWYYFSHSDYAAVTGAYNYYGIVYNFDEQGRLISGTWVESEDGFRYYHNASNYYRFCWQTIDGVTYFFDDNGYRVEGIAYFRDSTGGTKHWYEFDENGAFIRMLDGVVEVDGVLKYFEDGILVSAGLVEVDGKVYYARTGGIIATGKYYVNKYSTDALAAEYPVGNYYFAADGTMVDTGFVIIDGVKYYVENGAITAAGFVEVDGAYYYVKSGGLVVTGKYYATNCRTAELKERFPAGYYYFEEDGKLVDTGFITLDGVKYYVENGAITAAGFVEVDGAYYYVKSSGTVVTGKYYATRCRTAELRTMFPEAYYYFDADGKVIKNGFYETDGVTYFIQNYAITAAGLVEFNDHYYYAKTGGIIVTGNYYVTRYSDAALKTRFPVDSYYFDETGALIENGFIAIDGVQYYVKDGKITAAGLVEVNGSLYYARSGGKIATGKYYVTRHSTDTLAAEFPAGYYYFDETGAMIKSGFVTESGVKYYVRDGVITSAGLVEVNGEVYYARTSGAVATGKYYVNKYSSEELAAKYYPGYYTFDENGCMI